MSNYSTIKLNELADVLISNVDKVPKENEKEVLLCNFTDVYKNWAITKRNCKSFMKSTANDSEINKFQIKKGYVAITKDSETRDDIGISTYIADTIDNCVLGYHCALIKIKSKNVNGKYLNAVFNSNYGKKYFENNATGSGQRYTLTIDAINDFPVPIFHHNKICYIGNIMSLIDRKIEINNLVNDNLHQQLDIIYNYWFTQFDFLSKNGNPYKSSGGKMKWDNSMKEFIPESFVPIKLNEIFSIYSGYPFSSSDYSNEGIYKLITIKNVQDSGINLDVDNYLDNIPLDIPSYCLLKSGDILMSLTGNVGRVGLMYGNNYVLNQRVGIIVPKDNNISSYIYCLLKSRIIRKKLETLAGGSSQANLSPIEASNIIIPFNDIVANHFSKIANPIIKLIIDNYLENKTLISLRDWMLPMLMNGQVTITD